MWKVYETSNRNTYTFLGVLAEIICANAIVASMLQFRSYEACDW